MEEKKLVIFIFFCALPKSVTQSNHHSNFWDTHMDSVPNQCPLTGFLGNFVQKVKRVGTLFVSAIIGNILSAILTFCFALGTPPFSFHQILDLLSCYCLCHCDCCSVVLWMSVVFEFVGYCSFYRRIHFCFTQFCSVVWGEKWGPECGFVLYCSSICVCFYMSCLCPFYMPGSCAYFKNHRNSIIFYNFYFEIRDSDNILVLKRFIELLVLLAVGTLLGAMTGALIGQETESGFIRGAAVGAISGAVFSIEVFESSLVLWKSDESGIGCALYLVSEWHGFHFQGIFSCWFLCLVPWDLIVIFTSKLSNLIIFSFVIQIDVFASLLSGRLVRERIGPAMLSAVQSQVIFFSTMYL